jgi:predicted Zn-dependent protease
MTLFTGSAVEARRMAEEAVKRSPTSVDARLILGMALRSEGNLTEARRQLEVARTMSPDYLDVLQVLGGVAEQQDDLPAARAAYGRILQLEPGHAAARARLAGLPKGGRP